MIKDLYDISDTTDIPEYVNNQFISGHRLRQAILFLIEKAKRPVSTRQIRVAYYRKYHESRSFFDLSVTQVSLLISNLVTQKKIFRCGRGMFIFNKDSLLDESRVNKKRNKRSSLNQVTDQIMNVLPLYRTFKKAEIKNIVKKKLPDLNLNDNTLSSWIMYLRKRKLLNYSERLYSVNISEFSNRVKTHKARSKFFDEGLLKSYLATPLSVADIAKRLQVSQMKIHNYIVEHNIKRSRAKGSKVIDLKTNQIWNNVSSCCKDLKLTKKEFLDIIKGDKKYEDKRGLKLRYFKDIKKEYILKVERKYKNAQK